MHHYEQKKPKNQVIGPEEICTFSQCGELYRRRLFTPEKWLKRKAVRK